MLQPVIHERGVVEATEYSDVYCRVKAHAQAASTSTTIRRLAVADGARVTKGQLLMELDASGLERQLQDGQLMRERALADCTAAGELMTIQQAQNAEDLPVPNSRSRLPNATWSSTKSRMRKWPTPILKPALCW
jgi:multidrug efflux pump subunit AcrA (membrane-fusion protein)